MRLQDKIAVVTGGGISIGRLFSETCAREGATVVIADIDEAGGAETAAAISAAGGNARSFCTDVSSREAVVELTAYCCSEFGGVDVLINNAAIAAALPPKPLNDISVDEWDSVMAVNLRGAFLCSQAIAVTMKARGYGKIINVSSTVAYTGHAGRIAYASSKAGLLGLTRSLARSLGPDGIRVNALVPGSVASPSTLAIRPMEHFERAASERSLARVEVPDDLTGALIFLASKESDFVTGQAIIVDGGAEMR